MKYVFVASLLAAAALLPRVAQALDFPDWPLNATCDTTDLQCPRFEQRARGEVSGVWRTLPPQVQEKCLSEVKTLEPSYRLLGDCLALEMQELLKNQQRRADNGEVVYDTPKAKVAVEQVAPQPEPQAPPTPPEPQASQSQPVPRAPQPQAEPQPPQTQQGVPAQQTQ